LRADWLISIINKSTDGQNLNLCKLFSSTFCCQTDNFLTNEILWTFLRSQSKSEKSYWQCSRHFEKNSFIFVYGKFMAYFPLIYSRHLTILGSCYWKNKLTSVFYASVLLLMINFVITLSKFTAEPLACGSWFHSHFENVMTQFIINKRTDALKTDVNLLNGILGCRKSVRVFTPLDQRSGRERSWKVILSSDRIVAKCACLASRQTDA